MKINESGGAVRQVLKSGQYVCKIVDMIDKPDNTYKGESSPQACLYLQPLFKLGSSKPMEDVEGEEFTPTRSIEIDGKEKEIPKILFFNVGYFFQNGDPTFPTSDRSKYFKLKQAIFDGKDASYGSLEDYIEDTLVANVVVKDKEDGTKKNNVEAVSNHEDNEIKSEAEVKKVTAAWREMRAEVETRQAEKEDSVDLNEIPF